MTGAAGDHEGVPEGVEVADALIENQKYRPGGIEESTSNDPRKYVEWGCVVECFQ